MQKNAELNKRKRRVMTNPTFDDIQDAALRTWNRCAVAYNLANDKGPEASQAYMEKLSPNAQRQMLVMFEYIKLKGYEQVKREINRGDHKTTMEA